MLRVYHTFLRQSEGQKLRPIRCYNTRSPSEPAKESRASPSLLGKLRDQRLLAGLLLLPARNIAYAAGIKMMARNIPITSTENALRSVKAQANKNIEITSKTTKIKR